MVDSLGVIGSDWVAVEVLGGVPKADASGASVILWAQLPTNLLMMLDMVLVCWSVITMATEVRRRRYRLSTLGYTTLVPTQ
jgi:hypothetical protein